MNNTDPTLTASNKGLILKSLFSAFINLLIMWLIYSQVYQSEINELNAIQDEKLTFISNSLTREISSIEKLTKILGQGSV